MDYKRVLNDVRIRDPANRDQDQVAWRQGRFGERVRREWNQIRTAAIDSAQSLDELTDAIFAIEGGDKAHIMERLQLFQAMEQYGQPNSPDFLAKRAH